MEYLVRMLCLILLTILLVSCGSMGAMFRKHKAIYGEARGPGARDSSGPGEPLFLTPYIAKGQIDQGTRMYVCEFKGTLGLETHDALELCLFTVLS